MKKGFKRFLSSLTATVSLALFSVTAFAEEGATNTSGDSAPQAGAMGGLGSMLIMIVPLILVGYFLIYRPQKKRDKEAAAMKESLKPGDRITTIGGIVGTVEKITDEEIHLTNGLILKRWALRSIDTPAASSATYYEDEEDEANNKDE